MAIRTPYRVMEAYLTDVVMRQNLDLIHQLAQPNMIDEANLVFGGPTGRSSVRFQRSIGCLTLLINDVVPSDDRVMA